MLLQASQSADALPGGYGVALLQALLALAAVCILAWVVLRWAARTGLGIGARGERVKVIERVALDARRTMWLVQIGERVFLIGAGDGAGLSTLAELRPGELPAITGAPRTSFADVLARVSPSSKMPEVAPEPERAPPPEVDREPER
jgi:flagellar biogenesis protein FliO